jgi:DNA-binding transcriptional regulator YiaG
MKKALKFTTIRKIKMTTNQEIKRAIYNLGGLSIAAASLNVSTSAVSKWIRKGNIPNLNIAKCVAERSGFSLESLRPIFEQKTGV